jgi:rhodanese-related sulfurtransferase
MFSFFGKKKYSNISVADFKLLKKERNTVILDVRGKSELSEGSIPGHRQINVMDGMFRSQIDKLDRSKNYLVYCRSGMRSRRACKIMGKMGFENINNLSGGIMAWKAAS